MTNSFYHTVRATTTSRVIELVADLAGSSTTAFGIPINAESKLVVDCGFDSLDMVELLMSLEEEWEIEMEMDLYTPVTKYTVRDIVDLVLRYKYGSTDYPDTPLQEVPDVPQYTVAGVVGDMPGPRGEFTVAIFRAANVPTGTLLYTRNPPQDG